MIIEHLPWESVEGPKYYPQDLKPRKKWVTGGSWLMSAFLILGGMVTPYRIAAIFGLLYMLALMMVKTVAVTSRGVETYYQMKITTHYDFWSWDQIQSITREDRGHPELVALLFNNDVKIKRLFFKKADAEKVMMLAKTQNPRILTGDAKKHSDEAVKKNAKPRRSN